MFSVNSVALLNGFSEHFLSSEYRKVYKSLQKFRDIHGKYGEKKLFNPENIKIARSNLWKDEKKALKEIK